MYKEIEFDQDVVENLRTNGGANIKLVTYSTAGNLQQILITCNVEVFMLRMADHYNIAPPIIMNVTKMENTFACKKLSRLGIKYSTV